MKIAIISDIHYGEGEKYGSINPETRLNTRIEDIDKTMHVFIRYVIDNKIDLAVIAGDIYKTRKPTPTQQELFTRALTPLIKYNQSTEQKIPLLILPGNHDQQQSEKAHTASVMASFAESYDPYLIITSKPESYVFDIQGKKTLVVAMPYLYRQKLNMSSNQQVVEFYHSEIQRLTANQQVDSKILIGHQTVEGVSITEHVDINAFNEIVVPQAILSQFDAAFFGHIHKYQIVKLKRPLIVNQGNPIPLNFGEKDEKGFVVYDTEEISHQQIIIPNTQFVQFEVNSIEKDKDATKEIVTILQQNKEKIKGAIVKIKLNAKVEDLPIRVTEITPYTTEMKFYAGVEIFVERVKRTRSTQATKGNNIKNILEELAKMRGYTPAHTDTYLELGLKVAAK